MGACQSSAADALPAATRDQAVAEIQALLQSAAARLHIAIPDIALQGIADWVRELLFQHLIPTGYWDSVKNSPGVAPIPNPFQE
jgi:hypothetical protein